jgi:hypothetical protein
VSTSRAAKRQPELTTAGGSCRRTGLTQQAGRGAIRGRFCFIRYRLQTAARFHADADTPYHIGNGWFGGMLPATSFAIVASTGDIYAGLWYPIIFASITAVVGFFFLPETKDVDIKTN